MTEIFNNLKIGPRTPLPRIWKWWWLYDMLDLTEYVKRHHWWNQCLATVLDLCWKSSVATQIVMDEVSDRCVGFCSRKLENLQQLQ